MENLFNNKRFIPAELYDLLFEYIALNASKQILAWTPDYVRDSHVAEFDYTIATYPSEVNVRLTKLRELINNRNISDELRSHIDKVIHEDLLAVQQIAMLKTTTKRGI